MSISVLGDIHGIFIPIVNFCRKNEDKKLQHLIQVGDFGAGFRTSFIDDMLYVDRILREFNVILYIVRGNHDNPKYFFESDTRNKEFTNIKFLNDYEVLSLDGHNILTLGGAISIDKSIRTKDINWWVDEIYMHDPVRLEKIRDIDVVISHNAPMFTNPINFNEIVMSYAKHNSNLIPELLRERLNLTDAFNILKKNNKINKWVYGHFHYSYSAKIKGVEFILLGINELYTLPWKKKK